MSRRLSGPKTRDYQHLYHKIRSRRIRMKCTICKGDIPTVHGWSQGNNAEPVASGRCCDHCNQTIVVPTRLKAVGLDAEIGQAILGPNGKAVQ